MARLSSLLTSVVASFILTTVAPAASATPTSPSTATTTASTTTTAATTATTTSETPSARLERLVREEHARAFPEIAAAQLHFATFTSPTVFFMSNFDVGAALDGPPLALQIFLNPGVFDLDGGPGEVALRAILAHELSHSLDYVRRAVVDGSDGLVGLLPALVWPPAEEEMERRTDLVAVQRGYAEGLIAYRLWLYRVLDDDGVREKRRVYYSPIELSMLGRLQARCPHALAGALSTPPRSAREIARLAPASCF